jgi:two-component system, NarL family, sensor histidine kinase DegS
LKIVKYKRIIYNPHFWAILIIILALLFIYSAWPWREWQLTGGIWRWFQWLSSLFGLVLLEIKYGIIGLLFFIPIIYSALIFSWKGALIACIFSIVSILPIITNMWYLSAVITNIVWLLIPFFIISIITLELAWRRKERRVFAEREAERQVYVSKILESQENERQRIAQDLHDETIQALLYIANQAHPISPDGADIKEVNQKLEWIRDSTLQAIEGLRRTALNLRPRILDELGLVPAVKWLMGRLQIDTGINTRFHVSGEEYELTPQAEVIIFRVLQEALHNIERHSKARDAIVSMNFNFHTLSIKIEDDGEGFWLPDNLVQLVDKDKLGILGMKQRIQLLNGILEINSRPGEGTSVLITVSREYIHSIV